MGETYLLEPAQAVADLYGYLLGLADLGLSKLSAPAGLSDFVRGGSRSWLPIGVEADALKSTIYRGTVELDRRLRGHLELPARETADLVDLLEDLTLLDETVGRVDVVKLTRKRLRQWHSRAQLILGDAFRPVPLIDPDDDRKPALCPAWRADGRPCATGTFDRDELDVSLRAGRLYAHRDADRQADSYGHVTEVRCDVISEHSWTLRNPREAAALFQLLLTSTARRKDAHASRS